MKRRGFATVAVLSATLVSGSSNPGSELIVLQTPNLVFETYRIPDTSDACRAGAVVEFALARTATVSVGVGGQVARGVLDGRPAVLSALRLVAGHHRAFVFPGERKTARLGTVPFVIHAQEPDGVAVSVSGHVRDELANPAVLPVGHTFVRGVDLLDGHLVVQATDLKLEGRHLALEISRTYSSAGPARHASMGAGWAWSYDRRLAVLEDCDLFAVQMADGSSQVFRARPSGTLVPQRGYHTRLVRNRDGSFDFFDKSDTRHHFAGPAVAGSPFLRLEYMEEPHGDRVALSYDALGRLARVDEWHPALGPVRTLRAAYESVAGAWRIRRIDGWGVGLSVEYRHDRRGNLILATRTDVEDPQVSQSDRYEYSQADPRDPHQLVATLPAGEPRTDYRYFAAGDPFPGEQSAAEGPLLWGGKAEFVRAIDEAVAADDVTFHFDHARAGHGSFRADVVTGDGGVTRYRLNADGNPLEIDEPAAGKRTVWRSEWDPAHVVKVRQTNSLGHVSEYGYDLNGNLTASTERENAGAPVQKTLYAYDPRFNKLTRKQDPKGVVTRYEIHPQTGDLVRSIASDGKVTRYAYSPHGCLSEKLEDGARTRYLDLDSFCWAQRVIAPDGQTTRFRYDERGRRRPDRTSP